MKVKRYSSLSRHADSGSTGAAPTSTANEPYDAERVLARLSTTDSAPTWVKPPHVFSTPTVHATGSRSFFLLSVKNSYCAGTPGTVTRSVDEPTVLAGEANESSRHCVLVDPSKRFSHAADEIVCTEAHDVGASSAPPASYRMSRPSATEMSVWRIWLKVNCRVVDSDRRRSDGGAAVSDAAGAAVVSDSDAANKQPRSGAERESRLLDMAVNYLRPAEVR